MTEHTRKPDPQIPDHPPRHFSFLLRCMETRSQFCAQVCAQNCAQSQPGSNWRFSLQDPKSEAVHNFRDFDELIAFLQNVLDDNNVILDDTSVILDETRIVLDETGNTTKKGNTNHAT